MAAGANLSGVRRGYNLHGAAVLHQRETVSSVERGILAFLRHDFKEHVVGIVLFDALCEAAAHMHALICGIHEHPMHVCDHRAVVDDTRRDRRDAHRPMR